eukprot:Lithocolla_globosa_v1_NODE_6424_length_1090_cov_2.584541.p1 type:complete len:285 gc:universal NODE_6424_length_1090_cov_2.584541:197-1051(+)
MTDNLVSDNLVHAISGGCGGITSTIATYPLLNVATRLQALDKDTKTSTVDFALKLVKEDGFASLFRGVNSAITATAFTQSVFYYWYESIKARFEGSKKTPLTVTENLIISSLAGAITAVMCNPFWVVNTRLSVMRKSEQNKNTGTLQVISSIIKSEGITAFFSGVIPSLILVSNPAIMYVVAEQLKTRLIAMRSPNPLSDIDFFILGLLSKLVASTVTYPYIFAKTQLQAKKGKNTMEIISRVTKEEGLLGLFRGYRPRILSSVLTAAIFCFLVFFSLVRWRFP